MGLRIPALSLFAISLLAGSASAQFDDQWASFVKDNALLGPGPTQISSISDETDLAWGDLDQDGFVDVVVARKQPFTTAGKRRNMLLMNEGGVLNDKTGSFAIASDVAGDFGFATPTNDRDIEIADLNGDGYPEVITAVDLSSSDPKHISHPRVYLNLGKNVSGTWLGLRYEDARIPQLLHLTSGIAVSPRFNAVVAGDVDNDGDADLYFGDQDTGGGSTAANDSDDRLLINDGNGFFTDQSLARMTATMLKSNFCASVDMADFDGDGNTDILKQSSYNTPTRVYIAYNDPNNVGTFNQYQQAFSSSPYFVSAGELNNDGRPDIVVSSNGADRFLLNTGASGGQATFQTKSYSFLSGSDDGFGSNSLVADIDCDGWNEVLICDVDVELSGYNRRLHIYHNRQGTVGGTDVVLQEERQNGTSTGWIGVVGMTTTDLQGTHDVAVLDIDDDGQNDLLVSRKDGTDVWRNVSQTCQTNLGYGVGLSKLKVCGGDLSAGNGATMTLAEAPANALAILFVGLAANPTPVFEIQGTLVPVPWVVAPSLVTDAFGRIEIPVPGGLGPVTAVVQYVAQHDVGLRPSNAVQIQLLP